MKLLSIILSDILWKFKKALLYPVAMTVSNSVTISWDQRCYTFTYVWHSQVRTFFIPSTMSVTNSSFRRCPMNFALVLRYNFYFLKPSTLTSSGYSSRKIYINSASRWPPSLLEESGTFRSLQNNTDKIFLWNLLLFLTKYWLL